jgi:putative acetyltransferase
MIIRPIKETDFPAVRLVHLAAFSGPDEAALVDLLHTRGKGVISLVAVNDDLVIGHVLFSPAVVLGGPAGLRGLGLVPVAVVPQYQRKGAGTGMIQLGLKMAHLRGYDFCIVLGDPGYYTRFGFQPASHFGLQNEYNVKDEFMGLEFRRGALSDISGIAQYAPEFRELGV